MTAKERGKYTEYELNLRKSIAENLKRIMKAKGNMTQVELSKKSGIPTSTISDYVNARSLAHPGNVEKLARALGVSKDMIDPSFGDGEVPIMYDPRLRFFEELEKELGIDLSDPDIQKMLKKAAKFLFIDED